VHDRKFAKRIYEGSIKMLGHPHPHPDGALQATVGPEFVGPHILSDPWAECAALACAHEFGDWERYEAIKLHMDKNYEKTNKDGEAYYTFGLDETWPRGIPNHVVSWIAAGTPDAVGRSTRFRVTNLPQARRSVEFNGRPCTDWTERSATEIEITTQAGIGYFSVR
jgi:hypothetical protein